MAQVLLVWMLLAAGLAARYLAWQAAGVLAALAAGLLVLNGLGSIAPARDPENDYYRAKVRALAGYMSPDGLLVLGDPWPDAQHLQLHAGAIRFVALVGLHREGQSLEDLATELREGLAAGRPTYLWPDVLAASPQTLALYGPSYRHFVETLESRICGANPLASGLGLTAYRLQCIH